MQNLAKVLWIANIFERVFNYRTPDGCQITFWGELSTPLQEVIQLKLGDKLWSSTIAPTPREFIDLNLNRWALPTKRHLGRNYFFNTSSNLNDQRDWLSQIPKGVCALSLCRIDNTENIQNLKKDLKLNTPLWSESIFQEASREEKFVLLVISK